MKTRMLLISLVVAVGLVSQGVAQAGVASGGWLFSTGAGSISTLFSRNGCQLVGGINNVDGSVITFKAPPTTNQPIQISVTAAAWPTISTTAVMHLLKADCTFKEAQAFKNPSTLTLFAGTKYLIIVSNPAIDVRWTISCSACSTSNLIM